MITYTVHERADSVADVALRAESILFVKDGFAWLALFFPVLWMLFQRMWLVLLAFLIIVSALEAGLAAAGLGEMLAGWVTLGASVLFAFQANDLRRWTLARRGYSVAGLVTGRNREECEMRFFESWLAAQEPQGSSDDAPSSAPTSTTPKPQPSERPSGKTDDDVIGLFPEPNT
ncbi:MAG: DUF2628 domain-containing protein [Methyloligellaceae bacterium]